MRDGMIVSMGKPTGVMRTDRQFENFVMELEWRHLQPGGNAGLFVWSDALPAVGVPFTRSFEVQILDGQNEPNFTSHGDVFGIWGAKMTPDRPHPAGWMGCLPSEKRARPSPEWNHYRVSCQDGVLKLAVNGKEVSGASGCVPRWVHLPRVRRLGMPFPEPPHQGAAFDRAGSRGEGGARPRLDLALLGVDLRGWRSEPGHAGHWRASDSVLEYDGHSTARDKDLWTEKASATRADCRLAAAR